METKKIHLGQKELTCALDKDFSWRHLAKASLFAVNFILYSLYQVMWSDISAAVLAARFNQRETMDTKINHSIASLEWLWCWRMVLECLFPKIPAFDPQKSTVGPGDYLKLQPECRWQFQTPTSTHCKIDCRKKVRQLPTPKKIVS